MGGFYQRTDRTGLGAVRFEEEKSMSGPVLLKETQRGASREENKEHENTKGGTTGDLEK